MRFSKNTQFIVLSFVMAVLLFGGGLYIGQAGIFDLQRDVVTEKGGDIDMALFWEVWQALDERFVGSGAEESLPSSEERVFGAIQGLTRSFGDPYTAFLPPQEALLFEEDIRGNFGGVGMEIGIENEALTVIAPLRGTPAEEAGIKSGDIIAAVDGDTTFGMSVDEAVLRIRGEVGTMVTLTIIRSNPDEVFDTEVVRDIINIPTIDTELREDGVFVITLFNFGATSPSEFRGALREFLLSGSDALIFDLRGNPGGFLQASIDIASWFLPAGKTVVLEEGEDDVTIHRSRGYDIYNGQFEMVVLVDRGSASASEIVAGALSDHGIATLVGIPTFGKGSVQELISIGDESSLRVTVAHWRTPNGVSISEDGLTPDIVVEVTQEDIDAGIDSQLERAVALLLEQ